MTKTKNIHTYIIYSIISTLGIYAIYMGVIVPPFFGYYTVDENLLVDSGVFLWFGNTPRCLDWPASPSILLFYGLFAIQLLYKISLVLYNFQDINEIFNVIDYEVYRYLINRKTLILVGRTVQLIIVILILFRIAYIIIDSKVNKTIQFSKFWVALMVTTSYCIWLNTPILRPEAIAGILFLFIVSSFTFTNELQEKDTIVISLIFGIIMAQRLLFAFFWPTIVISVYFLTKQKRKEITIKSILISIISLSVFCPFLISDSLVMMKSFVGGILIKINDTPMDTFLNYPYINTYLRNYFNLITLIFFASGIWNIFTKSNIVLKILIVNFILYLFFVLHSSKIYDTHILPLSIIAIFIEIYGLDYFFYLIPKYNKILYLFILYSVTINLNKFVNFQNEKHITTSIEQAYHKIKTLPKGSRLIAFPEFDVYLQKSMNCLLREQLHNNDTQKKVEKLNYSLNNKNGAALKFEKLPLIINNIAFEDEDLYESQYNILIKYANLKDTVRRYDFDIYLENTEYSSHSIQTNKAVSLFKAGDYDYFVSDFKIEGFIPEYIFNGSVDFPIYFYRNKYLQ